MISDEQRAFIENLYELQNRHEDGPYAAFPIRRFALGSVYLRGCRVHRLWRNQGSPISAGMIVRAGDKLDEIASVVSIILWECSGVKAAHDQLLSVLCDMQSNAIKRDRECGIGDVLFTLDETMFLFTRANLALLIRNAGSRVFSLKEIAQTIDTAILRHLQKHEQG